MVTQEYKNSFRGDHAGTVNLTTKGAMESLREKLGVPKSVRHLHKTLGELISHLKCVRKSVPRASSAFANDQK